MRARFIVPLTGVAVLAAFLTVAPRAQPVSGPEWAAPAASTYYDMRKTSIYGGATEVQKNIISKMILGF